MLLHNILITYNILEKNWECFGWIWGESGPFCVKNRHFQISLRIRSYYTRIPYLTRILPYWTSQMTVWHIPGLSVVDDAPKKILWRVVEAPWSSLKDNAQIFVLLLCSAQLVLRSSVLTVLDLEVGVTLRNAEIFESVLSGKVNLLMAGGAAELLPVSLSCPLPLRRTQPLPVFLCCFLFLRKWAQPEKHPDGWRLTYFCLRTGVERATLVQF